MVSCHEMDEEGEAHCGESEDLQLPTRMFARKHEPEGIRVSAYHTYDAIRTILAVLEPDEVKYLTESPFGKFISTAEKPSFSGRIGRLLLSRQLKVKKKHEVWFLFASKPIRFSLREFAIVTGLKCGKLPKQAKKRMRTNIVDKPYWPTLFGNLESVSVKDVIRMLKKKTVKDMDTRIKYACLALLASVLLPTTHNPKISKEHAELIKDIDQFFNYPWGRLGFDLLMGSIKKRDEVSLSQDTVALKGFVQSIQLVLAEAVPELTCVVAEPSSSASEEEREDVDEDEDEDDDDPHTPRISLNPALAREIDAEAKCQVNCITPPAPGIELDELEFQWSDDECDKKVDNIVKLVGDDIAFDKQMFKGGATRSDVARMRVEAKNKASQRKSGKRIRKHSDIPTTTVDINDVAGSVVNRMKEDFKELKEIVRRQYKYVTEIRNELKDFKISVIREFKDEINKMRTDIVNTFKHLNGGPEVRISNTPSDCNRNRQSSSTGGNRPSTQNKPTSLNAKVVGDLTGLKSTSAASNEGLTRPLDPDMPSSKGIIPRCNKATAPAFVISDVKRGDKQLTAGSAAKTASLRNPGDSNGEFPADCTGENFTSAPSFSLRLTQNNDGNINGEDDVILRVERQTNPGVGSGICTDMETSYISGQNHPDFLQSGAQGKKQKTTHTSVEHCVQNEKKTKEGFGKSQMIVWGLSGDGEYSSRYATLLGKIGRTFTITVGGVKVSGKELREICDRTNQLSGKMMDVLVYQITQQYIDMCPNNQLKTTIFLDNKFVGLFSRNVIRFNKTTRHEIFRFPQTVVSYFNGADATPPFTDRYYFPFNVEKKHWVGICLDCRSWTLIVLDCNTSVWNDKKMTDTVKPIAQMFPYLLKQVGRYLTTKDLRPFSISRPLGIPQNKVSNDSGVTTALLIQAHALGGMGMCSSVNEQTLQGECEKLVVLMYEENGEDV